MTHILTFILNIINACFKAIGLILNIKEIDNKRLKHFASAGSFLIFIIINIAIPLINDQIIL